MDAAHHRLAGVDPILIQHPFDRQAIASLKRVRGFEFFLSKFVDAGVERMEYQLSVASGVRVGPRQLPSLHGHLRTACAVLGVPEPELYVCSGGLNSSAAGPNHPYIVLMSGVLGLMDDAELAAVIAHEVGHVRAGHLLYKSMASAVDFFGGVANDFSLGFSKFVTTPVQVGLLTWDRWSELTADRAALLVVRDPRVCLRLLMKLGAGASGATEPLDLDAYIDQVRAYAQDTEQTLSDRVYHFGATMQRGSLPFTIQRARALLDWYESGGLDQVQAQALAGAGEPALRCPACSQVVRRGSLFCGECGARLPSESRE
ncbi:MAG TPA: M48 family metallopeptidase [Chloroflexota bacterium]|nr:M48 family metallopeptidase [Chloroflexota bacterium]